MSSSHWFSNGLSREFYLRDKTVLDNNGFTDLKWLGKYIFTPLEPKIPSVWKNSVTADIWHEINQPINQPTNQQSTNQQSTKESSNPPINCQPINQTTNNQPINQSTNTTSNKQSKPGNQPMLYSTNQLINQPINPSTNQSTHQPID